MSEDDLKKHAIFMCMVTTMMSISFFSTLGVSWQTMMHISLMLLIMWPTVFGLKELITAPIVKKLHQHVLSKVAHNKRHTYPFFTIFINSGLVTLLLLLVAQIYPNNFLATFLNNWERKLMVLIPLFFLILRPTIEWLFNNEKHQLIELIEAKSNISKK